MLGCRPLGNPLLCHQLPLFSLVLISENCANLQITFASTQGPSGGLPAIKRGCQPLQLASQLVKVAGQLVKVAGRPIAFPNFWFCCNKE